MSRPQPVPGRFDEEAELAALPRLRMEDPFPFVCAGCGDCCRARRDIVLSGLDLYRLARRLRLPPATVAEAFCRETTGLLARTLPETIPPHRQLSVSGSQCLYRP